MGITHGAADEPPSMIITSAVRLPTVGDGLIEKELFIISTSGFGNARYRAELRKVIEEKGYQVVDDFACKGWDTYGPSKLFGGINKGRPKAKDLGRAREFARGLKP